MTVTECDGRGEVPVGVSVAWSCWQGCWSDCMKTNWMLPPEPPTPHPDSDPIVAASVLLSSVRRVRAGLRLQLWLKVHER